MPKPATDRSSLDDVIDEYKKGIDRTLLRENLRRTIDERLLNLAALREFHAELVRAGRAHRAARRRAR